MPPEAYLFIHMQPVAAWLYHFLGAQLCCCPASNTLVLILPTSGRQTESTPPGVNSMEIHPSIGTIFCAERWCCLSSLLGYWTQSWMGHHSDTVYQEVGTHFADLGRMTGRINPTWYYFNSRVGVELRILGSQAHHSNH